MSAVDMNSTVVEPNKEHTHTPCPDCPLFYCTCMRDATRSSNHRQRLCGVLTTTTPSLHASHTPSPPLPPPLNCRKHRTTAQYHYLKLLKQTMHTRGGKKKKKLIATGSHNGEPPFPCGEECSCPLGTCRVTLHSGVRTRSGLVGAHYGTDGAIVCHSILSCPLTVRST